MIYLFAMPIFNPLSKTVYIDVTILYVYHAFLGLQV